MTAVGRNVSGDRDGAAGGHEYGTALAAIAANPALGAVTAETAVGRQRKGVDRGRGAQADEPAVAAIAAIAEGTAIQSGIAAIGRHGTNRNRTRRGLDRDLPADAAGEGVGARAAVSRYVADADRCASEFDGGAVAAVGDTVPPTSAVGTVAGKVAQGDALSGNGHGAGVGALRQGRRAEDTAAIDAAIDIVDGRQNDVAAVGRDRHADGKIDIGLRQQAQI